MNIRIVIDSTTDIPEEIKQRVTTVPLTVNFSGTEYKDGVDITKREFYEKLIECNALPTTSQPSPAVFESVYSEAKNNGEIVIVITLSSELSGTYRSAKIAAEEYDNVYIVDGKSAAIGTGILVKRALQMIEAEMNAEEIVSCLNREKNDICVIAMLDTLEYLRLGGRISRISAIAGEILSIKPVIGIKDGMIKILGKARGSKQGNNLLIKQIEEAGGVNFEKPLLLGYTGLSNHILLKYIDDSSHMWKDNVDELRTVMVGSVIGTHTGPGAIAVAFFKNNTDQTINK